jgi:hypothetical protein
VVRVDYILLASLKITAGPTPKDLDPDSIRINDLENQEDDGETTLEAGTGDSPNP